MDNLIHTEFQKVKVQIRIFIVALICLFIWFLTSVGSVFLELSSSTDNAIFYRVAYLIGSFCYALLIACFAKYMKVLNFKLEQIFSYIVAVFVFVSAIIFFVISLYLEHNAGNDDIYYYTWMYSVLAMFANIIRALLMIALGISLIVRKGNNVEGLKVVGFLCLFSVLLNFGAYLFQMIGMQMETYYGVFGDYKVVVFITSILYIFANFLFAGGIVYFLLKSNQKYKDPKFDMPGLN